MGTGKQGTERAGGDLGLGTQLGCGLRVMDSQDLKREHTRSAGGKQGSWEGQRTEGSGAAATEHEQARCRHHWLLSIKQAKGQSPHLHMPGPRQRPSYLTLPRPEQGQPRNVESPGQGGGSEWGLRPPPQASCQRPETPSCHRKSKSPSPCHRRPGAPATNADTPAGQMLHRAAPH